MKQDQLVRQNKSAVQPQAQSHEAAHSAAPPSFGLEAGGLMQQMAAPGKLGPEKTNAAPEVGKPVLQGRFLNNIQVNFIATNVRANLTSATPSVEVVAQELSRMRNDVTDIAQLNTEYNTRYSVQLSADLAAHFSGADLALLNSLLRAAPAAAPAAPAAAPAAGAPAPAAPAPVAGEIRANPTNAATLDAATTRAHTALHASPPNTAELYATLIPLDGKLDRVVDFRTRYSAQFGTEIFSDMISKLTTAQRKYALRLIFHHYPDADGDIMGLHQAERAERHQTALSITDSVPFILALDRADTFQERQYIYKALAANRSVTDIVTFAATIKGKGNDWMQNNLRLTGSTTGTGIQQQWSHSCNATATQAGQGEADPIYALSIHTSNPNPYTANNANGLGANPALGATQQGMLTSTYVGPAAGNHAGVASPRNNIAGGGGRWADDLMNANTRTTGLSVTTSKISATFTVANAVTAIETAVRRGNPVSIVIGNSPTSYTHYVTITRGDFGVTPHKYWIHDPWNAVTVERTRTDLVNGTINLANSNQISAVEVPAEVNN